MNHSEASHLMASEKYLLDELSPDEAQAFEDHLFDCHECAMDVRTGSLFLEHSKLELAKSAVTEPVQIETQKISQWAWWRPQFAIPVMAVLLLVIGYQNLATRSADHMRSLPAAITLNLSTYGDATPAAVRKADGMVVNVIIPPGHRYSTYKADLHKPGGSVESVPLAASAVDTWGITVPGSSLRGDGNYKLIVYGWDGPNQDVEVGSSSFQLQILK
jgi:hypothetical protein